MKDSETNETDITTDKQSAVCKQLHREIHEELKKLLKNPEVPREIKDDVVKHWQGNSAMKKGSGQ